MQILSFSHPKLSDPHLGAFIDPQRILDLTASGTEQYLSSALALISGGARATSVAASRISEAQHGNSSAHIYRTDEVEIHAPIPRPLKNVYCVGLNYRSHVEQNAAALHLALDIPEVPLFFSKPVTAVIGSNVPIRLDTRLTERLDYEVELGLVIGRGGRWIPEADALGHIFGYTIINDVSARDLQLRTSQFLFGKGQDSYCPIGPVITTVDEFPGLDKVELRLEVNGEVRQREVAANMLFPPARVISELSKGITLEAGDIISLGTPGGCGYQMLPPRFLQAGDVVECAIDGIGVLRNTVKLITA